MNYKRSLLALLLSSTLLATNCDSNKAISPSKTENISFSKDNNQKAPKESEKPTEGTDTPVDATALKDRIIQLLKEDATIIKIESKHSKKIQNQAMRSIQAS